MQIISRKEAKELGIKRYFTGKPCPKGHRSERYVTSGGCLSCVKELRPVMYEKHRESRLTYAKKYYVENSDRRKEYSSQYRLKNIQRCRHYDRGRYHSDKGYANQRQADWRSRNKDIVATQGRRYRAKHRDRLKAYGLRWRKENPLRVRALNATRRALLRSAEGVFSHIDVEKILKMQGEKCANCRKGLQKTGYHVDHIQPIARGGSNWPENLQILCPPCNLSKHAKDPIEWARQNGRLI